MSETVVIGGHDGPVRIVSAEPRAPYDRPPLSKELLAGDRAAEALRFRDDAWYVDHDVDLLLGRAATGIDPAARRLLLAGGSSLGYDRLVVATGAIPRTIPALEGPRTLTLRSLPDAQALRERIVAGTHLVVLGGGFIGLEVAATARRLGAEVTVVEAEPAPLVRPLGAELGAWFAALHRDEGVNVHTSRRVIAVRHGAHGARLTLDDGSTLAADVLLVAVGAVPDTSWLAAAGLPGDGVPVGPGGVSAVPCVLAAGDAARPIDPRTGHPERREHWEAAARSGAAAARTILGQPAAPEVPHGFWSDQHGLRIQLVGDPADGTGVTLDGDPSARSFAATWWRGEKPVAVLLAGRPADLPAARRLVAEATADLHPHPHPNQTRTAA
jgi:3-phenylpropionate/trans-cinnamate dioxygenase ferredoxin reductase component